MRKVVAVEGVDSEALGERLLTNYSWNAKWDLQDAELWTYLRRISDEA